MTWMRRLAGTVAVIASLALAGCAGAAPAPTPTETPVAIPATPVGERVSWILDALNAEADTSAAEWESALHPDFVAEVPASDVADLLNTQVRPARPLRVTDYRGSDREAVATVAGTVGDPFDMTVAIDEQGLVTAFVLAPTAADRDPAASVDEVAERLAALGPTVRVLAVRGDQELIVADADAAAPLGSVFKLYVLAAVADAVDAGALSWDDTVTVTDDARSLPSGELQDAPTGTQVSIREAAGKMIALSDNTATDLLIHRVGREAVEAAVGALGTARPDLLTPLPTTREFFALLWGGHDDLVQRWSTGDQAERRAVLAELDARPFEVGLDDIDERPGWTEGIEWFASARDVAAALEGLHARAGEDSAIAEILGENRGISIDPGTWPEVAFKGGSSPGVVAGSWRAQDAEGIPLTVVVLASDESPAVVSDATRELFALVEDLFAALG